MGYVVQELAEGSHSVKGVIIALEDDMIRILRKGQYAKYGSPGDRMIVIIRSNSVDYLIRTRVILPLGPSSNPTSCRIGYVQSVPHASSLVDS